MKNFSQLTVMSTALVAGLMIAGTASAGHADRNAKSVLKNQRQVVTQPYALTGDTNVDRPRADVTEASFRVIQRGRRN